jgi:hypothetical protein
MAAPMLLANMSQEFLLSTFFVTYQPDWTAKRRLIGWSVGGSGPCSSAAWPLSQWSAGSAVAA